MGQLSDEARQRMIQQQLEVRTRISRIDTRYMQLSGRDAIVQAGASVVVRFFPRWDFKLQYMLDPATQRPVRNPQYPAAQIPFIYVSAWDHWYDDFSGKRRRALCLRNLGADSRCPLCEAAEALMRSEKPAEREQGSDLAASDFYLFNAIRRVMRPDRKVGSAYKADGTPDLRIFQVPASVWLGVSESMTGGPTDNLQFARGEIFDTVEGFDFQITRPVPNSGDKYKVICAPQPSSLFLAEEAAQWKGWPALLYDLAAEIGADKHSSYQEMFQSYYGQADAGAADPAAGATFVIPPTLAPAPGVTAPVVPGAVDLGGGTDLSAFGFEMPGAGVPGVPAPPAPGAAPVGAPAPDPSLASFGFDMPGAPAGAPTPPAALVPGRAAPAVSSPPPGGRTARPAAPGRRTPPGRR